jgi:hypothetical protein
MSARDALPKFEDPLKVCRRSVHALKTLETLARFHRLEFRLQNVWLLETGHVFYQISSMFDMKKTKRAAYVVHVMSIQTSSICILKVVNIKPHRLLDCANRPQSPSAW